MSLFIEKKYIKEVDGEYCVYSEQTGKSFGCYKTKPEAEARLAQMHKFKGDTMEPYVKEIGKVFVREVKGGAGSGNFGHEGRPGEVGGSGGGETGVRSSPEEMRQQQEWLDKIKNESSSIPGAQRELEHTATIASIKLDNWKRKVDVIDSQIRRGEVREVGQTVEVLRQAGSEFEQIQEAARAIGSQNKNPHRADEYRQMEHDAEVLANRCDQLIDKIEG